MPEKGPTTGEITNTPIIDRIPLPATVVDAINPVHKDKHGISVKINGKKLEKETSEAYLDSTNHAFYIGKARRETRLDHAVKALGIKTALSPNAEETEPIYNGELFSSIMDYGFAHLKPGEKLKIIVGRVLSELYNGPDDTKKCLTFDEQKAQLLALAKKKFNKEPADIEILSWEDLPEHKVLFSVLNNRKNMEEGLGDGELEELLSSVESMEKVSSLNILKCLFRAQKDSPIFHEVLKGTVPKRLRDEADEESILARKNYGMTEIALRLSELIHGKKIQGGVSRQYKYDEIIEKIIKGDTGPYKNIKTLQPLFDLLKDLDFQTVHIDPQQNYFARRSRKISAITRLALAATLGAASLTGVYEAGRYNEYQKTLTREEVVNEYIRSTLKKDSNEFYYGGADANLVLNFAASKKQFERELGIRYGLDDDTVKSLEPSIINFLLHERYSLFAYAMSEDRKIVPEYVDKYILTEGYVILLSRGHKTLRPYQHLMPHLDLIKKTAESGDEREISSCVFRNAPPSVCSSIYKITPIGGFIESELFGNEYELFIVEGGGEKFLAARDIYDNNPYDKEHESMAVSYSGKKAKQAAKDFLKDLARYDVIKFKMDFERDESKYPLEDAIRNMNDPALQGMFENESKSSDQAKWSKAVPYEQSGGNVKYEVLKSFKFIQGPAGGKMYLYFLARLPGESTFTYSRAKELLGLFCKSYNFPSCR